MNDPLDLSRDVSLAINHGEAVVALESSVIAQGLPPPANSQTALAMESIVGAAGARPATIGLIGGRIRVGLTADEIARLSTGGAAKIGARDLPLAIHKKLDGGTTVSATIRIASAARISVMATGGIGGVHRGFAETLDISADLWELARTPIIVVCSGAKAVLDLPATVEWLETHGVAVYGLDTDEMPAFYSRKSGIGVPSLGGVEEVAEVAKLCHGVLGSRCAMIIAVPVPEEFETQVEDEIAAVTREAAEKGVAGKDLTPFLLRRVGELTGGKSIEANVAVLKNNARVAAEIAKALFEDKGRKIGLV